MRFRRWFALVLTPIGFLIIHVGAPWGVSRLSTRHGWTGGAPGALNLLSLAVVALGTTVIWWGAGLHLGRTEDNYKIQATPDYLLKGGPYLYSRNPIYVGVMATWFGWALFYGSVAVTIAVVAIVIILSLVIVPWEERNLEARFGESYLDYKRQVGRWIGR